MSFLTKAQAIQLACANVKNVSCQVTMNNSCDFGSFSSVTLFFWHNNDIASHVSVSEYEPNSAHRINMIIKHGLFGRIKVEK